MKATGFILYPREYNTEKNIITGVNACGLLCTVRINADPEAIKAAHSSTAKTVPEASELARTDRKAKTPCFASPDNCKEKPAGVMLIEQASVIDAASREFECKWVSVLRESSDMLKPLIGPGYLEICHHHFDVTELTIDVQDIMTADAEAMDGTITPLDAMERKDSIMKNIMQDRRFWFIAVVMQPLNQLVIKDPTQATKQIIDAIDRNTRKDAYGGVLIRGIKDGKPVPELSFSINNQFQYKRKPARPGPGPGTGQEAINFKAQDLADAIAHAQQIGATLQAVPTMRVNCGPMGNDMFHKQMMSLTYSTSKVLKSYVDMSAHFNTEAEFSKDNKYLASRVAVRLAEIPRGKPGAGNVLCANVHSFSASTNYLSVCMPPAPDQSQQQGGRSNVPLSIATYSC